jgi:hypothetical protein
MAASGDKRRNLEELLASEGLATPEQLERARFWALRAGQTLAGGLVATGFFSEQGKNALLKKKLGIEAVDLGEATPAKDALALLPRSEARRLRVVPLRWEAEKKLLVVAMENPADSDAIAYLELVTGARVEPQTASAEDVDGALADYPFAPAWSMALRARPLAFQLFLWLIVWVIFFVPLIVIGWALFESDRLQTRLISGATPLSIFALVLWCGWGVIVWLVYRTLFDFSHAAADAERNRLAPPASATAAAEKS